MQMVIQFQAPKMQLERFVFIFHCLPQLANLAKLYNRKCGSIEMTYIKFKHLKVPILTIENVGLFGGPVCEVTLYCGALGGGNISFNIITAFLI